MLGFAPLAAMPLASVNIAALVLVQEQLSATGGITFAGSPYVGAVTPMRATGGLAFAGSATPTIKVYTSATGGIAFSGSSLLTLAGRPLEFFAVPQSYTFRADGEDMQFVAQSITFDFRGVPE